MLSSDYVCVGVGWGVGGGGKQMCITVLSITVKRSGSHLVWKVGAIQFCCQPHPSFSLLHGQKVIY